MQGSFILFPDCIFKLPPELIKLWILIRKFDWEKEGEVRNGCTASITELARLMEVSPRQVQTNLRRLEKCRAIQIEERPRTTHKIYCTPERFDENALNTGMAKRTSPHEAIPMEENKLHPLKSTSSTNSSDDNDIQSDKLHPLKSASPPEVEQQLMVKYASSTPLKSTSPKIETPDLETRTKNNPLISPFGTKAVPEEKGPPGKFHPKLYSALLALTTAAKGKLVLPPPWPTSDPPPGFQGNLPPDAESHLAEFIRNYVAYHHIKSQEELELDLKRLGDYLAAGIDYCVWQGRAIDLRWLCNSRNQDRVFGLIDKAKNWDGKIPTPQRSPIPLIKDPTKSSSFTDLSQQLADLPEEDYAKRTRPPITFS